jgi:dihydroflavonol-4-reductase
MAELDIGGRDLILVTGASGFLGAAIANSARAAGYPVRVLIRASSPRTNIHHLDQVAVGDLRDRESIAAALRGVRYLIHAAADYRLWSPSPEDILRNNVEGTRTLMEEALRAGVERIVYTSSVATIGLRDGEPADETRPLPTDKAIGAYKKSKVMAERVVCDLVACAGLPAVIVNPSTPIGPRDIKPTPTGRIIVEAARGRMPGFVDTGLNLVHVDDAAAGHIAALHRGRIGERYILGGENVHLRAMLADVAAIVGRHPRRPADGAPAHVLFGRQGAARSRPRLAALS